MEGSVEVDYHRPETLFSQETTSTPPHKAVSAFPILEFLFFHKAIKAELTRLYEDALAVEKGGEKELKALYDRYEFLRFVYTQHSNAEDEVIFPALDSRVKNIAKTYSLEHKEESDLFDQMLELLNLALIEKSNVTVKLRRQLICCTEAIQTTLCQHLSKEEKQVLPLLVEHFSFDEQAGLVWQFMCSIPVNLMEIFLPWLVSYLSPDEHQEMIACMHKVIPQEELLQKVIFAWLRGPQMMFHSNASEDCVKNVEEYGNFHELNHTETSCNMHGEPAIPKGKRLLPSKRKAECLSSVNHEDRALWMNKCFPVDMILYWHTAIRKELCRLKEVAKKLQSPMDANFLAFCDCLQFLVEACIFRSAAKEKVLFPAMRQKTKQHLAFASKHAEEERCFDDIRHFLEGFQLKKEVLTVEMLHNLYEYTELISKVISQNLLDEAEEVLPIARECFSMDEQRGLVYQCLRVMPLKQLEKVLPWLISALNKEEAENLIHNICIAAPKSDAALVTLLMGWACKGRSMISRGFCCISFPRDCFPGRQEEKPFVSSFDSQGMNGNAKCPLYCHNDAIHDAGLSATKDSQPKGSRQSVPCCVPALGVGISNPVFGAGSRRSMKLLHSKSFHNGYLDSGLFGLGKENKNASAGSSSKPIDTIFQFHKAIRKDLEYLDDESAKIADCDAEFLRQFNCRFRLLWGLYRAHSNAEDDIVFPALEAREALHNVSHSYTIDHKHEEELFKEISNLLSELSCIQERLEVSGRVCGTEDKILHSYNNDVISRKNIAAKLQGMCKSVHVTLDQHVSREEIELWPLFSLHFTVEEQERIVGQIIGTTGAEVLQAMLPWVTTALSEEEQSTMMDTWLQVTRNTMFDKWLQAWWTGTAVNSPDSTISNDEIPESGTPESLQLVADYLTKNMLSREDNSVQTLNKDCVKTVCINSLHEDNDSEAVSSSQKNVGKSPRLSVTVAELESEVSCHEEKIESVIGEFKPGWQDIFRMNEKELEAAVRRVSGDTSLDPRRKAYLMQNLLTSRWIVAQQQASQDMQSSLVDGDEDILGRCPSYTDESEVFYGCEHYKRNCKVRASCCGILFTCQLCHDKVSDHSMNRQATKEMMCMRCLEIQSIGHSCSTPSCEGFLMAKYYCNICKLFDDSREIYHCPSCNLCRVGKGLGIDFFHCMTCNACMSTSLTSHKCREKGLESNCPICHDFLFTSHTPVKALSCGHFMHSACYRAYTYSHYTCPICSKSLGAMDAYFGMLDALLASEQLPEEYRDREQDVLCNDCEQKGTAPFHWLYHKCKCCGSYNTRTI